MYARVNISSSPVLKPRGGLQLSKPNRRNARPIGTTDKQPDGEVQPDWINHGAYNGAGRRSKANIPAGSTNAIRVYSKSTYIIRSHRHAKPPTHQAQAALIQTGLPMPLPRKFDIAKGLRAKAKGQSYDEIAKAQGVHKATAYQNLAPILEQLASPEVVETYRNKQAEILDGLAARTLASITNGDLAKAGLRDKVVASGILIDKSRLVQGQSTGNYLVIHADAARTAAECWGDGRVVDADHVDTLTDTPDGDDRQDGSDNS